MKNAILSKVGRGNTYTKKSRVHSAQPIHAFLWVRMPSIYSSKKCLLSGRHTDFDSRLEVIWH